MEMILSWLAPALGVPGAARDAVIDTDLSRGLAAHLAARRALARALAAQRREADCRQHFVARSRNLEACAVAALRGGREDLAVRASEAIAAIEGDLQAADAIAAEHNAAVTALRRTVEDQRRRLADLDRGRRLLAVQGAVIDARSLASDSGDPLSLAEAALAELSGERRATLEIGAVVDDNGAALVDDMAEAGFCAPSRPTARAVLARIRASAIEVEPVEAKEVDASLFDRLQPPAAPTF